MRNKHLDEALDVLRDFKQKMDEKEKIWRQLSTAAFTDNQYGNNSWETHEAECWLYATINPEGYSHSELLPVTMNCKYAEAEAAIYRNAWEDQMWKWETNLDCPLEDFPKAEKEEFLAAYINRLCKILVQKETTNIYKRLIFSFFHYLRERFPENMIPFLDTKCPQNRKVRVGIIERLIFEKQRPLPIQIAGSIIKAIADKAINGRKNGAQNLVQVLAMCWLSLSIARLRIPVRVEDLHQVPLSSLQLTCKTADFNIPSQFGWQKVHVSDHCHRLLLALQKMSQDKGIGLLFIAQLPALRRTLRKITEIIAPCYEPGDITFMTFQSNPHYTASDIR